MYQVASLTFAILSSTRCQTPTTDKTVAMMLVIRWMEVANSSSGLGDTDDGDDEDDNDVFEGKNMFL